MKTPIEIFKKYGAHYYENDEQAIIEAMQEYANQFTPKWIPVGERLPDEGVQVLISLKNGEVTTGSYGWNFPKISKHWWRADINFGYLEDVTHWMPLPTPPKQ